MSNAVVTEQIGNALVIRFNRPEIRSPLSIAVLELVSGIMDSIEAGGAVEKVVFTGTADVFASGADLREIATVRGTDATRAFALRGQELMSGIAALPFTTIAAINGYCFGGALDLALACDRRIASTNATFSHPGANLGIITGWGGTQRLPRLVGEAVALEMFMTSKRVKADEALSIGLVHEIAVDPLRAALAT